MQSLNEITFTQLILHYKVENWFGYNFWKPSKRKLDIVAVVPSLNTIPQRSCFKYQISFKEFSSSEKFPIFFSKKKIRWFGTFFSANIGIEAKILMWLIKVYNLHRDIVSFFWYTLSFLRFFICFKICHSREKILFPLKFCANLTSFFPSLTTSYNLKQTNTDNRLDSQNQSKNCCKKQHSQQIHVQI